MSPHAALMMASSLFGWLIGRKPQEVIELLPTTHSGAVGEHSRLCGLSRRRGVGPCCGQRGCPVAVQGVAPVLRSEKEGDTWSLLPLPIGTATTRAGPTAESATSLVIPCKELCTTLT